MNGFFKIELISWSVMLSIDYCSIKSQVLTWMEAYL